MSQVSHAPNILEVLDGIAFPVTIVEMVSYAEDQGASEEVLDLLQAMPEKDYRSLADISANLGRVEDLPGAENLWSSDAMGEVQTEDDTDLTATDEQLTVQ